MVKDRLKKPFTGFDSIDPRMCRVPLDLRKQEIRTEYLKNHQKWFLKNHHNSLDLFKEAVINTYGKEALKDLSYSNKKESKPSSYSLLSFFDNSELTERGT